MTSATSEPSEVDGTGVEHQRNVLSPVLVERLHEGIIHCDTHRSLKIEDVKIVIPDSKN